MKSFVSTSPPMRVVFGCATIRHLAEEAETLNIKQALVLSTPEQTAQAQIACDALEGRAVATFLGAVMHTPVEVTEAALAKVRLVNADAVVSVGGGSTIGLGKALALRTGMPHIAVPTTYAGSEMTQILGETARGIKKTMRDPKILPNTVIYDVELTLGLPPRLSGVSGLNAMAHAIEALYARDTDPIVQLMAEEGIRALYVGLPGVVEQPQNIEARSDALYGAWLCGTCLGRTSMALHHKLCHVLGGAFNLPHAETHAIVLPHALAYNAQAVPDAIACIMRAIGRGAPAAAFFDLNASFGAPTALRDLGMPEDGIESAVSLVLNEPYWNPRPLERDGLCNLITDAWNGDKPSRKLVGNVFVPI
jgi:maleylacetate reductase